MDKRILAVVIVAVLTIGSAGVLATTSMTNKSPTSITLVPTSSSIEMGKIMHADGQLSSWTGIPSVKVNLKVTLPNGMISAPTQGSSIMTDSTGVFAMDFTPTVAGTYTFTATFTENTNNQGCSVTVPFLATTPIVSNKIDSSVALTLATASVDVGTSMHANGQLTATTGIAGVTVALSVTKSDGSVIYPRQGSSVVTDSSGKFAMDFTPTVAGTYTFAASFAGNDEYKGSSSTNTFTAITPTPVQCEKPWPSKINMIDVPTSMIAGQTYTFKGQLLVRTYDIYCKISPWLPGIDAEITWTFTNSNGISVSIDSTSSLTDGIATVEFPCYMAGKWNVEAHFAGNAKYMQVDGHTSSTATGDTIYWHGFWITVEKWYITADPNKYPVDFGWNIDNGNDPVFVLLKVKNAQNVINTNLNIADLYVTDTNGQAYWGMSGRFIGTNDFTSGLAPGAEAKVWVCFWIPNSQSLVINGLYGVVHDISDWYYQDYGYIAPTTYNVKIPLPIQSPA